MMSTKKRSLCWISVFMAFCCMYAGLALCEIVYYVNPNGGIYYHLDQNCPTIHRRYLPLKVSMTKEELEQPENSFYQPCSVCVSDEYIVPEELRETGSPTEAPVWEMIVDPQYSEYALTNRYIREAPVFLDEHNMLAKRQEMRKDIPRKADICSGTGTESFSERLNTSTVSHHDGDLKGSFFPCQMEMSGWQPLKQMR